MDKKDQLYLYAEEKIGKAVFLLAIPSLLSSVINLIYNTVNSIFIGQMNNTAMIASITVSMPLTQLLYAFSGAIGVGASSYISRQLGAQKYDDSRVTVKTAITLSVLVSIVMAASTFVIMDPILHILTSDAEVFGYAHIYTQILLCGGVTGVLKQVFINLLRAEGDILFPMYALLFSVLLNIVIDPVLMYDWGLGLGITGAALATIIVQTVTMLILLYRLSTHTKYVRWKIGDFGVDVTAINEISKVGLAVFVRNILPSISSGVFAVSANLFGTSFVAGVGIGKRATNFGLTAIQGIANGYLPFAAYNYGAQNKERLRKSMSLLLGGLTAYAAVVSLAFLAYPSLICRIFTSDVQSIHYGSLMLQYYTISFVTQGVYNILLIALQAFGQNRQSMIVSLFRGAIIYIPALYFLPRIFGEVGMYLTQPASDWATVILVVLVSRNILKELFQRKK